MGSNSRTRRCCYGAAFGLGFFIATLILAAMFWIAWCYFGLAVVQLSDTQRRALVNYSYTTSKPTPTPALVGSIPGLENSISKSTSLGGSGRVQPTVSTQAPAWTRPDEVVEEKTSVSSRSPTRDSKDDRIHARKVSESGAENKTEPGRRQPQVENVTGTDIAPTQVYNDNPKKEGSTASEHANAGPSRDNTAPRDYADGDKAIPGRKEDIQSSRRLDRDSVYEDPDFDRDYPRRYADRGRSRYDDEDERDAIRSRYDGRDRGRQTDDRLSKGDARVYPDDDRSLSESERLRPVSSSDERYKDDRVRSRDDRYDERQRDGLRRGDDRDYDDRKYRSRDPGDTSKYRDRFDDDRYDARDSDRLRSPDDDRYRSRNDDRYARRDDDRYSRSRDGDRYRDDDRYRARSTDDHKRDSIPVRPRDRVDNEYDYRPRIENEKFIDSTTSRIKDTRDSSTSSRIDDDSLLDRRPLRSSDLDRSYDRKVSERDRSRHYSPETLLPTMSKDPDRSIISENSKYRDRKEEDHTRSSRTDNLDDRISPSRTREVAYISRSTFVDPQVEGRFVENRRDQRSRDDRYMDDDRRNQRPRDDRYMDDDRRDQRPRDDRYMDDDRRVRINDSRGPTSSSRRASDDRREEYRTRLPDERLGTARDEVVLDRRSYASDDDDEYRMGSTRSRPSTRYDDDDSRERRPVGGDSTRDYRGDDRYSRQGSNDEDYRKRGDYDDDRSRYRDNYGDEFRRRERYRDERRYLQNDSRVRNGDSIRASDRDIPPISKRVDEDPRDAHSSSRSSDSRRGDEDAPQSNRRDSRATYPISDPRDVSRQALRAREPLLGSSARDVRDKRYQTSDSVRGDDRKPSADTLGERPLSTKDVIETALRQSDASDQNTRKVYYPVFDPRVSNLTSPDIIRPSERRGTTITARKRRR